MEVPGANASAEEIRNWVADRFMQIEKQLKIKPSKFKRVLLRASGKGRVPDRVLRRIEKKVDMLKLVGRYVKLQKKGGRWWGLCPFHDETTPSFTVDPEEKIYYCLSCHKGGSLFTFIMDMEHIGFREAVEWAKKRL